jgi:hypothetical protein
MSAKAVRKWGSGFFEGLNSMSPAMAFAGGGMVGGATYNNSSSPSFNINISGSSNPGQTAAMVKKEVMAAMRREEIRNK